MSEVLVESVLFITLVSSLFSAIISSAISLILTLLYLGDGKEPYFSFITLTKSIILL